MVSQHFEGISCSLLLGSANGGSYEGYWVTVFAYICNYMGLLERPSSKVRPIGENDCYTNRGTFREQHETPLELSQLLHAQTSLHSEALCE